MIICLGSRPQESKNSLIRVKETKQLSTSSWGMRIGSTSGATVSLTVMPPADAFVGEYSVYVETKTKKPHSEEEMSFRQKRPEKIYILFNAWVKGKHGGKNGQMKIVQAMTLFSLRG